jgi:ABC-type multidrug transport system ATPase subunit
MAVSTYGDDHFIEARDVVKRYGSEIVANAGICLDAYLGEIVAIVGPNGAGKTTFILQLLGLLAPTSGMIRVGEVNVGVDPDGVKRLASYQPQNHMAMGGVEVRYVLPFTGRLRGLSRAEAGRQAEALIAEFGLAEVRDRPLHQLSGGWRRLVDVAVAFMGRPKLIVLDEPTNDLDPVHRRLIWGRLNMLRQSREITCLLVTHNLLEAERVVDRVMIINQGRVKAFGSPGALKQGLDGLLRLDVYVRGESMLADAPTVLPELGPGHQVRPGHLQFFLTRDCVPRAMAALLAEETRHTLDDFRLAPPSLEDVYLHMEENEHGYGAA